ncbi:MAG: hypothetical protein V4717_08065 [Bacteroidota bacterium]
MKSIFLSAALAICLFATASGTREKSVANYRIIQSFNEEFGRVENLKWSSAMNNLVKADFELDNETMSAYFDENGEYVASTKIISLDQLPKKLQASIKEKVGDAKIDQVFEMTSIREKSFFVETTSNNEKKVWKGDSFGKLTRYYLKP